MNGKDAYKRKHSHYSELLKELERKNRRCDMRSRCRRILSLPTARSFVFFPSNKDGVEGEKKKRNKKSSKEEGGVLLHFGDI